MNSDFEKDFCPIYFEKCKQQGFIFADDMNTPMFVVCSRCGWEASQVWCPKCGMGGDFINDLLVKRPTSWTCPDCKTIYELPSSFYKNPVHLYLEDNLPEKVLERCLPKPISKENLWLGNILVAYLAIGMIMTLLFTAIGKREGVICTGAFLLLAMFVIVRIAIARNKSKTKKRIIHLV